MDQWYQTIWGIILLGAIGSLLGALTLKIIPILINKVGLKIIEQFASNLLIPYAENKCFVKMCEKNNKPEFIIMRYNMIMNKYSRVQIIFVFGFALSLIMWVLYFSNTRMTVFAPLLFFIMALKDLYDFIKYYIAVSGCLPDDIKSYIKQIETIKKEDKDSFIKQALEHVDS